VVYIFIINRQPELKLIFNIKTPSLKTKTLRFKTKTRTLKIVYWD